MMKNQGAPLRMATADHNRNLQFGPLHDSLTVMKRSLAEVMAKKKYKAFKDKTETTGVACTEPCSFPRCMNTCRHEMGEIHQDHVCSTHDYRVQEMSQQVQAKSIVSDVTQKFAAGLKDQCEGAPLIRSDESAPLRSQRISIDETREEEVSPMLVDSSSDEESIDVLSQEQLRRVRVQEEQTGQLDFDYVEQPETLDTYLVKPSGQLRNHIRSLINQTWTILSEEHANFGDQSWSKKKVEHTEGPEPDPKQVWWTDAPRQQSSVMPEVMVRRYYSLWRKYDSPCWSGPLIPQDLSDEEQQVAKKEAKSLPEYFYEETKFPVITPQNVDSFIAYMKYNGVDLDKLPIVMWSWFAGTSRFLATMMKTCQSQAVLFPVDLRYGWNIQDPKQQLKLIEIDRMCRPLVTTMEPRCKYWSIAGRSRKPEVTQRCRNQETDMLNFIVMHVDYILEDFRHCLVENPETSKIWTESPLAAMDLFASTFPQCAHSEKQDGERQQKMTTIKSSFPMQKTTKECNCLLGHIPIRGMLTAPAAAF